MTYAYLEIQRINQEHHRQILRYQKLIKECEEANHKYGVTAYSRDMEEIQRIHDELKTVLEIVKQKMNQNDIDSLLKLRKELLGM